MTLHLSWWFVSVVALFILGGAVINGWNRYTRDKVVYRFFILWLLTTLFCAYKMVTP
jgi:hypothetical protein